jgi:prepilin-type N-terminal cleavage/methylation domain-containing protein
MLTDTAQSGFTLVEVILALAISALLASIISLGQSGVRSQVQFSDTIDHIRNDLTAARNQATTTVSTKPGGAGLDSTHTIFGKLVTFEPCPPGTVVVCEKYTVTTVTADSAGVLDYGSIASDGYTVDLAWNVKYDGYKSTPAQPSYTNTKTYVLFARSQSNGRAQLYFNNDPAAFPNISNYASSTPTNAFDIHFHDLTDHTASVILDPTTGNVSRTIY